MIDLLIYCVAEMVTRLGIVLYQVLKDNSLNTYRKVHPLVQDDIRNIEQGMARYVIAIRKVLQNFDNSYTDFNYNLEELNNLIIDVFEQQNNVHKLLMRKLYQD